MLLALQGVEFTLDGRISATINRTQGVPSLAQYHRGDSGRRSHHGHVDLFELATHEPWAEARG